MYGFLELEEDVIKNGFCTYCGACSSFCKNIVLNETPRMVGSCVLTHENVISCGKKGLCYDICPVTPLDERIVEMKFLDGKKDDLIGKYLEVTAGRSHIEGQDGGMVSSILQKGLEMGYECAIVAMKKDGFDAVPSIAKSYQDILEAKGTKYVSVPMMSKLKEAVKSGFRKIMIVATHAV
ncbi:hypothetical protein DRP05_04465 [Archaeoglobales archaeon]|nr:MAG: hypothetical protein DRP05_04465 [Archaeoglobales archaeon]